MSRTDHVWKLKRSSVEVAHERLERVQTLIIVGRWHDDEHDVCPSGGRRYVSDDVVDEDFSHDVVVRQVHPNEDALDSGSEMRRQETAELKQEYQLDFPGTCPGRQQPKNAKRFSLSMNQIQSLGGILRITYLN